MNGVARLERSTKRRGDIEVERSCESRMAVALFSRMLAGRCVARERKDGKQTNNKGLKGRKWPGERNRQKISVERDMRARMVRFPTAGYGHVAERSRTEQSGQVWM